MNIFFVVIKILTFDFKNNYFTISDFSSILVEGENVLAIQAHNVSSWSSDFTIIPFLSAIFSSTNNIGIEPPEVLNLNDNNNFHTNFKISNNKIDEIIKSFDK